MIEDYRVGVGAVKIFKKSKKTFQNPLQFSFLCGIILLFAAQDAVL